MPRRRFVEVVTCLNRSNQVIQLPQDNEVKPDSDFEEEIIVTRQQEERDPEAEAEFDREFARMMSESLDSRKFDRKPMFDVPLPMRRAPRDTATAGDESPIEGSSTPPNTMAFSLMTKKGNRQQVCLISGECTSAKLADRLDLLNCLPIRILQLR